MEGGLPDEPRLKRSGEAPKVGIVHLGPGAFFRAFNAVYTDEAMANAVGDWGICAVSLRSPTARDQLDPQGGAFTSVTLSEDGPKPRVIESISRVLVAPEDPNAVVDAMADAGVKIVSLTITEKGYCHEPATGALNRTHPDVVHDLANIAAPRTAVGFIVAALAKRHAAGGKPFTVLSCDNLPSNGALARGTVLDFARAYDPALADWIAENVPFPATMVDRITPATTDADVEKLAEIAGYHDPACVFHEAFRQWVIEDDFADGRPAWDSAGAQFVKDVDAHELMKLRCLNGTHSTMAYLGYLAGLETVGDVVRDPDFAGLCEKLWHEEIIPTLPQPDGEDLPAYCATLMDRFKDTSIRHKTWQIAMDGSQKLPQRLLGTIADNLAQGHLPNGLILAVAAWMRYVGGTDEKGDPIDVRDPMADQLKAADGVFDLLGFRDIFSETLAQNPAFRAPLTAANVRLQSQGARAAVKEYIAQ